MHQERERSEKGMGWGGGGRVMEGRGVCRKKKKKIFSTV